MVAQGIRIRHMSLADEKDLLLRDRIIQRCLAETFPVFPSACRNHIVDGGKSEPLMCQVSVQRDLSAVRSGLFSFMVEKMPRFGEFDGGDCLSSGSSFASHISVRKACTDMFVAVEPMETCYHSNRLSGNALIAKVKKCRVFRSELSGISINGKISSGNQESFLVDE